MLHSGLRRNFKKFRTRTGDEVDGDSYRVDFVVVKATGAFLPEWHLGPSSSWTPASLLGLGLAYITNRADVQTVYSNEQVPGGVKSRL